MRGFCFGANLGAFIVRNLLVAIIQFFQVDLNCSLAENRHHVTAGNFSFAFTDGSKSGFLCGV